MDVTYKSALNAAVPVAAPGEFSVLHIGPLEVWPPVVLAPMAGVTNPPFRSLCRAYGAGLYVSEMVAARLLANGGAKARKLAEFAPEETVRSLQLYAVDPYYAGEAVRWLVGERGVGHIDMNFGCPVPKVTRKGGGSAIPLKPRLLRNIVAAAVEAAGSVPVTMKFRMGIDEGLLTYLEAGRIGEEEGCAAVALHARTAAQFYGGEARWEAIATLKQHVTTIPVLGNGDIWEAWDALRMMRETGCDGVVVGRGCLGRPWLFRDLADVFAGREPAVPPNYGAVVEIMLEHARGLVRWMGSELHGVQAFRKHASWYTKGFQGSVAVRRVLFQQETLADLEAVLRRIDCDQPFPLKALRVPRGKSGGAQQVALPHGYLDNLDDDRPPAPEAGVAVSGG